MICGHCKAPSTTIAHVRSHTASVETQSEPTYGTVSTLSVEEFVKEVRGSLTPVTEVGLYERDKGVGCGSGEFYRVVLTRGTERLYAKRALPEGGWDYEKGAIFRLYAEDRCTVEEISAVGRRTGTCMVCARHLTNPVSVATGIGPICGGRV